MLGVLALAGCGGSEDGGDETALTGTIRFAGLDDETRAYAVAAAEGFEDERNPVTVEIVGPSGAQGLCLGIVEVGVGTSPLDPAQLARCKASGVGVRTVPVAADATVIAANSDLELSCLSLDQAQGLLADPGGTTIDLGADADTGEPISSSKIVAAEHADSDSKTDSIADGPTTVGSMALSGFLAAEAGGADLVSIDAGAGCVPPREETVLDGSYPLTHQIFLFFDEATLADDPKTGAFAAWLAENQASVAAEAHTMALLDGGQRRAEKLLNPSASEPGDAGSPAT